MKSTFPFFCAVFSLFVTTKPLNSQWVKTSFLFVSVIFLFGCSPSSHVVGLQGGVDSLSYVEFNATIRGERVKIELTDGRKMEGSNLEIKSDSAKWNDARSHTAFGIKANQIKTVIDNNHWSAALNGLGRGAIGGGLLGYTLVGLDTRAGFWSRLVGGVIVGTCGGILGGIGGLVIGHEAEYNFVSDSTNTNIKSQ